MNTAAAHNNIHTLVFDWGDTLMTNFTHFDGPMVDWPHVETVPGIGETLETLSRRFRLVTATNAADSDAAQVEKALARVNLDSYFEAIYTSKELGYTKPNIGFFKSLEEKMSLSPRDLAMIGDNYLSDITGAWHAGWETIWYSPSGAACPALMPIHHREIQRMEDLPEEMERPPLPGWHTCLAWLLENDTTANLLQHVQSVAAAAYQIAIWLRAGGTKIDPLLTHRGALLHDMTKLSTKKAGGSIDHGETAAVILAERNLPELCEIVWRHPIFSLLQEERKPETWEQIVVYLADKYIEGASIASLEQRLYALQQRYPHDHRYIHNVTSKLMALQEELCGELKTDPQELLERLEAAFRSGLS